MRAFGGTCKRAEASHLDRFEALGFAAAVITAHLVSLACLLALFSVGV